MTPTERVYEVPVLDESQQSIRVMDVPGYSHMSAPYTVRRAMKNFTVRKAYIFTTSTKADVQQDVKSFLGGAYWSGLNIVQVYRSR